ncbi:MAG TPA: methionyl-tRNA formyltransferase [Candidatus Portnoybacteria bacterium]|jgi:methionyl-tRNA formyltransferase|nr:methionyl-tRNA formyltransferase [Candidatus Portnoybacteria bacterium]HOZ16559.1 methionyl-tRNA formyltransferase [Candidatus Portnoybacteria bacterium]HPH52186.1 methionyl-tRNA formyltransferase [Candidatus Portnoybacteria bacterium]HPJ80367.1 methionyl-tRNA formyltransferase [Candidatus Portnoybacteria bacterium]HPM28360.1 methionyl-tRNA formyltransferase [Candidatus Portnoybacteria bacterium]
MQNKIRTILMGTPEFAESIFRKFYDSLKDQFEIITVVTAPDKPIGRKQVLSPSPVKKWATEAKLMVLQPDKIRKPEWVAKIKNLNPDLIILTAFGQIIPQEILDIPKYKALNIHPSLLPKYRGASPIQSVILNGEKETGVCLMIMDAEMDHGQIISNLQFSISNKPTYTELSKQLSDLGAKLLIKVLPDYIDGKIKPQEQDHSQATLCKLIRKEDGKIDWNKSAEKIDCQIRAFQEWPESYTDFNGKVLKILEANIESPSNSLGSPMDNPSNNPSMEGTQGEIKGIGNTFLTDQGNLAVQTGNGILILKTLQLEGKNSMSAKDFLNGHKKIVRTTLK